MSLLWWQCVAVVWNRTAQGASKNYQTFENREKSIVLGRAWYTDSYTDVYNIIA